MCARDLLLQPREPAIDLVNIISEGTYTSFPQALKEFISNAWDALATRVRITVDEESESILILDDGNGLTSADFENVYASIARRGSSEAVIHSRHARLRRKRIGRFGIGALAVAGIANRFVIRSTKRGSKEGFEASIDLAKLRQQFDAGKNLSEHWRFTGVVWNDEALSTHFTEIRIDGLRKEIWNHITRPGEREIDEFFSSVSQLSGIDELRWRLGVICPVPYKKGFPVPQNDLKDQEDRIILLLARRLRSSKFRVYLNDKPVFRPIYLPAYKPSTKRANPEVMALFHERKLGYDIRPILGEISGVQYHGYLTTQAEQVYPEELRGVLIRVRGVAVGWHHTFHLSIRGGSPALPSMSGEIWAEGLEEALQFDRESFRHDHTKYRDFEAQLADIVHREANLYRLRSTARLEQARSLRQQKGERGKTAKKKAKKIALPKTPAKGKKAIPSTQDQYLVSEIFEKCKHYITNTVHQINGCWNHEYWEACAVMTRRLLQILIIELYRTRAWEKNLRDNNTGDYIGLKAMIGKVKGDRRFGFDSRVGRGLDQLKELGDIAAHDYRVRVRKTDLQGKRELLRYTCERLVFELLNS